LKELTKRQAIDLEKRLDPEKLLQTAYNLPRQINDVVELSTNWEILESDVDNVLMIGMGGSAIGGDLIKAFSEDLLKIPVSTCRNYSVPNFVNSKTLCLISTYSGNTEETLSAYRECLSRKAKIIVVSTNGKIEEQARKNGNTLCKIPGGLHPRSALGYMFSSLYVILVKSGLLSLEIDDLSCTADFLLEVSSKWHSWKDYRDNPPLALALEMEGKIPVIYSSSRFLETLAYRWKCQFNENAKMLSWWAYFPELNHNEIVGWGADKKFREKLHVIILRDPDEYYRTAERIRLTRRLMEDKVPVTELYPLGKNRLDRLFYFILFGDLLSIYTAYLYGKNPAEIDSIHWLKSELEKLDQKS